MRDGWLLGLRLASAVAGLAVFLILLFGLAEIIAERNQQRASEEARGGAQVREAELQKAPRWIDPFVLPEISSREPLPPPAPEAGHREQEISAGVLMPPANARPDEVPPAPIFDPLAMELALASELVPPVPAVEIAPDKTIDLVTVLDEQLASVPVVAVDVPSPEVPVPVPAVEITPHKEIDLAEVLNEQLESVPAVVVDVPRPEVPVRSEAAAAEGDNAVDMASLLPAVDLPQALGAELAPPVDATPAEPASQPTATDDQAVVTIAPPASASPEPDKAEVASVAPAPEPSMAGVASLPPPLEPSPGAPEDLVLPPLPLEPTPDTSVDVASLPPLPEPAPGAPTGERHDVMPEDQTAPTPLTEAEETAVAALRAEEAVRPAEPAPAVVHPEAARESAARDLAVEYFAAWSSDSPAASFSRFYDPTVDFHGKRITREQVIQEKRRFMKLWPQRAYTLRGDSLAAKCSDRGNLCIVQSIYDYKVANQLRRRTGSGVQNIELHVSFARGEPAIVYEKSEPRFPRTRTASAALKAAVQEADPADASILPVPSRARREEPVRPRRQERPKPANQDNQARQDGKNPKRLAQNVQSEAAKPKRSTTQMLRRVGQVRPPPDDEPWLIELPARLLPRMEWEE